MTRRLGLALVLVAGCGNSSPGTLVDPGPPPENGLQIILPIVRGLEAGSDNELCTWTNVIADRDLAVRAVQAFQSATGHHVVVYKTKSYQPAGTTRKCSDDDLTTVRFVAGAGGEGIDMRNEAPGNIAFAVEKDYQLVINQHFLNATLVTHDAQSAVNLYFAEPGSQYVRSAAMAIVDTSLDLPPGQPTKDIDCTLENDIKAWFSIPHMHHWGSNITVDHVPAATGVAERLFDTEWTPEYTFHPPEMRLDPSTPKWFHKGDHVKVRCTWNNDTGHSLGFGPEMCVFFAQTVDDVNLGNLACDGGRWSGF
jgi:hypothetical protein